MARTNATDSRERGTPLAAHGGVIFATREMLVDGLAIIRESVRRKPIILVGAFVISALAAGLLLRSGRRW